MNFYEILKTKKLGRGSPDYWTQLFAEHVGGKGEWAVAELTGTLPITFRSNGTALINYKIYGTAEGAGVQTENLLPYVNGTYTNNRMTVTCNNGRYVIDIAEGTGGSIYTIPLPEFKIPVCQAQGGNGVFVLLNSTTNYSMNVTLKNGSNAITGNLTIAPANRVITNYSNDTSEVLCNGLQIYCGKDSGTAHMELSPMLVNTAQAPETYIPYGYQIPLTVTSGTESKTADIYIGSAKLLSADYIDYESGKIVRDGTPQDPPLPLPEIETFNGTNTLDSIETVGEVTIKGQIKPQS